MSEPRISNQAYYDTFAKSYDHGRDRGYHLLVDEIESGLVLPHAAGKRVLEVGCGTGLILQRIACVASEAKGIDLSEGMLEHARRRGLDVRQASATELPFEDCSFDVSYSFKVLAHVPDVERAIAEMSRVTVPGGRCLIEMYNKHSLRYAIRRLRGGGDIGGGLDDNQVYFRFHSPRQMRALLPPELELIRFHGVRLFTVLPQSVDWPLLGPLLQRAERLASSSRVARFGGFVVMECRKRT